MLPFFWTVNRPFLIWFQSILVHFLVLLLLNTLTLGVNLPVCALVHLPKTDTKESMAHITSPQLPQVTMASPDLFFFFSLALVLFLNSRNANKSANIHSALIRDSRGILICWMILSRGTERKVKIYYPILFKIYRQNLVWSLHWRCEFPSVPLDVSFFGLLCLLLCYHGNLCMISAPPGQERCWIADTCVSASPGETRRSGRVRPEQGPPAAPVRDVQATRILLPQGQLKWCHLQEN